MDEISVQIAGDLQRIEVRPGDRFVLKIKQPVPMATLSKAAEMLEKALGAPVIPLDHDMDLALISKAKG